MKRIIAILLACVSVLAVLSCTVLCVSAEEEASPSLTLVYRRSDEACGGLGVCTYRIGELSDNGDYRLCGRFADYPVQVYSVESQTEWRRITSTLVSYIEADAITPDLEGVTDSEGKATYSGVGAGLYLTLSVRMADDGATVVFEDFITAVSDTDVSAYPKHETQYPVPGDVEFKVVKQWKDTGARDKRPSTVKVDILREGSVVESVTLSQENDWCYSWMAPDDRSAWYAVEREVPEGYKVSVTSDGRTIVITNTYETQTEPPDTGDTEVLWHYLVLLFASGALLITLGVIRMRMEK